MYILYKQSYATRFPEKSVPEQYAFLENLQAILLAAAPSDFEGNSSVEFMFYELTEKSKSPRLHVRIAHPLEQVTVFRQQSNRQKETSGRICSLFRALVTIEQACLGDHILLFYLP
ncbi:hypothetical protein PHMEG_0009951 [Phytophthora megakarya]|uniref:Uncharacterized protein n=1 Tax=Phytophthora megakarya TaxID=4795 RepID=A0A225WG94_9STRA|nr:hypothetical protein PHMEG_0009951 [Phytophthora megakarya]